MRPSEVYTREWKSRPFVGAHYYTSVDKVGSGSYQYDVRSFELN
jgi:hypothetical protein